MLHVHEVVCTYSPHLMVRSEETTLGARFKSLDGGDSLYSLMLVCVLASYQAGRSYNIVAWPTPVQACRVGMEQN